MYAKSGTPRGEPRAFDPTQRKRVLIAIEGARRAHSRGLAPERLPWPRAVLVIGLLSGTLWALIALLFEFAIG